MDNNKIEIIYVESMTLKKSLLNNENKANDLRKLYEKLCKTILEFPADESLYTLHDLINLCVLKKNKPKMQYICHSLRKDLNPWAHDNPNTLSDEDLEIYFTKFINITNDLTDIPLKETNDIKEFTLENLQLNDEQKKAVLSSNKLTLVNAGPGTGKTYLIVGRVLNELNKNNNKKIFALSFTNKASDELSHKIYEHTYTTNLAHLTNNIFTGTIHSFVLTVIQEYFHINDRVFDYNIVDDVEFKEIKEELENNENLINQYLKDNKLLTFDNIIELFLKTIKNNENFQHFLSEYFEEIIIDEAQDLDKLQYEIIYLLKENIKNLKIFFVGDQRQNIYAFKGGSLNNILDFFEDEKDFSFVELKYSYRCPQNTLSFVNKFDFNDTKNTPLQNAASNNGNYLQLEEFSSMKDEGNWVAKQINSSSDSLSEVAIIYSNTFYFKNILESLNAYKIPFKVMGGQYYLNKDIRLIRHVLNYIYTNNKFALRSIQNILIKKELDGNDLQDIIVSLSDMNYQGNENYAVLYNILKFVKNYMQTDKPVLEILKLFIEYMNSNDIYHETLNDILSDLVSVLENDLTLEAYEKFKVSFSPMHPTLGVFYARSDEIVLSDYYEDGQEFVTVTTIHSAKGLEWNTVIIPGMSQDAFPRYFKLDTDREKEMPNELKKFYVACTRTKKNLYFTRAVSNQWGYKKDKSIFLKYL